MVIFITVQVCILTYLFFCSCSRAACPGAILKTIFLYFFASAVAFASQTFYIDAPERGKQYQVTTTAKGIALALSQRWLYQPSVIKMDDGRYVMLFVTCGASGSKCLVKDQGLYVASSRDGVSFALENQGMPILHESAGRL